MMAQPHRSLSVCIATLIASFMIWAAQPARAELASDALARQVTIKRDQWGVPHIYGDNINATIFGFGYAQAEDHPIGVMQRVLHTRGQLAQFFGPSQVDSDVFMHRFHIHDFAASEFNSLDAELQDMFDAFALGYNMFIEGHRDALPAWVSPITGIDVFAMGRASIIRFAFRPRGIETEIAEFIGPEAEEKQAAWLALNPEEDYGSNMWALGPERTTSGKAILLGNPHQAWKYVFYEAHLIVPGEYNIYGATFLGSPIVTIGFNENLGWSHTVNYPDMTDVYAIALDPDKPDHYMLDGESHALGKVEFALDVRGEDGVESQSFTFWECDGWPVMKRTEDTIFVAKSSPLYEVGFSRQWYAMSRASNLAEFRAALDQNSIPMFNSIYADREGNILYHWMARLPRRPEGQDGRGVVAVSTKSQMWQEVVPNSELPSQLNPEGGYVQNSNDPPWYTNLYEPIDPGDFASYYPEPNLRLRSQHGLSMIHNRNKLSTEDIRTLKYSMRMVLAERIRDDLVAAVRADRDANGDLRDAAQLLAAWDGTNSRESRGSVLFKWWWNAYNELVEEPWRVPWNVDEPVNTPRGLADAERGVEALSTAIAMVNEKFGSINVAWGEVHRLRRGNVDVPIGGGESGIGNFRVLSFKEADDGKQIANSGDSWVFVAEFGDVPEAWSIVAYSESENPASPHHTDQSVLFADNQFKKVNFTDEAIENNLAAAYHPGGG